MQRKGQKFPSPDGLRDENSKEYKLMGMLRAGTLTEEIVEEYKQELMATKWEDLNYDQQSLLEFLGDDWNRLDLNQLEMAVTYLW